MKRICLLVFSIMCFFNVCSAQEPAPFHDTWTMREYYKEINNYLSHLKITGCYFYDVVNGLETYTAIFDKNPDNILLIGMMDGKIVQIVSSDENEMQLNDKILATLNMFGANAKEKDLMLAKKNGAIMIKGNDRDFIIRYEKQDIPTYIIYAAK